MNAKRLDEAANRTPVLLIKSHLEYSTPLSVGLILTP
jgi:hypothetical protein